MKYTTIYKGAKVIVSNSDSKNIDKINYFFDDLYSKYTIVCVCQTHN